MLTKLPAPTRCPKCGHMDRTTVCRYCKTDKMGKCKPSDREVIFQKFLDSLHVDQEKQV